MTTFWVSPAERNALSKLGENKSICERYGADVLWFEPKLKGFVGVQRKEIKDLIASLNDGRLARELQQLQACQMAVMVVEGRLRWSSDGVLMASYVRWTRAEYRGLLRSLQLRGVYVEFADDVNDTLAVVLEVAKWAAKDDHTSLDRRPKASTVGLKPPDHYVANHLLQAIPGIGNKQADDMLAHFAGRLPLTWTVGEKELLKVKGLGPKRVEAMTKLIPAGGSTDVPVLTGAGA